MSQRVHATKWATAGAIAWLARECRRTSFATEIGYSDSGILSRPNGARYRADVASVDLSDTARPLLDIIEVKGTLADFTREDLKRGKWVQAWHQHGVRPWIAGPAKVIARAYIDLPTWGMLVINPASAPSTWHARRQPRRGHPMSPRAAARALMAISEVNTAKLYGGRMHNHRSPRDLHVALSKHKGAL